MFEQRTEAEMRLHSEKTARELALKRRQQETGDTHDTEDTDGGGEPDEVTDTSPESSPAGEAHTTVEGG
ncbi:hypothetical protein ACWD4G_06165 [Streptomyces sp. NPDC002643]